MWEKKKQTTSPKKKINDNVLNDIVKIDFLNWLKENNYLTMDQEKIWVNYITNRDK